MKPTCRKKFLQSVRFSFPRKTKKYLTRLFEATYISNAIHDLLTTKGEENKSREGLPACPWSHAPRKVFYGPYNRTGDTHSCFFMFWYSRFFPLPLLFFLVALLTSCLVSSRLLQPEIVAVNNNDPRKSG